MINFFLFFQRNMKKKIIIRTSLFLYTCLVIGIVTVLVLRIRTNRSKQKSPTEEETTTEETTTEETTTEETTTPSTLFQKSGNTVKVLSIIVFVLEVLMLINLLFLCTLFSHNHIILVDNKFFQKRITEKANIQEGTDLYNANKKLIPKIKMNIVVSTLFVFANILIIVIPATLYQNMDKLKFILNGIGIFLTFVTMLLLSMSEKKKPTGILFRLVLGSSCRNIKNRVSR